MSQTGVVLAADRRIAHGPVGGPFKHGESDKLFAVRSCAVASFGSGPLNTDVPQMIRSLDHPCPATAASLASSLYARVSSLRDPGDFGMLVLGIADGAAHLCEVHSRTGITTVELRAGHTVSRGVALQVPLISAPETSAALREWLLSVFRQVARQNSAVGPPYEFATLTPGAHLDIMRSDA